MNIGDHVQYEHKGHRAWGIVRQLTTGMFGEPRALIAWVAGDVTSPFPVCLDSLTPDSYGVVAGTLGALTNT